MSRNTTGFGPSFDLTRSFSCSTWALDFVPPSWTLRLVATILAVFLCWPLPRSTSRPSCIPSSLSHVPSIACNTASSCRISFDVPGRQNNHLRRRWPGLVCAAFAVTLLAAPESPRASLLAPRFWSWLGLVRCIILRATAVGRCSSNQSVGLLLRADELSSEGLIVMRSWLQVVHTQKRNQVRSRSKSRCEGGRGGWGGGGGRLHMFIFSQFISSPHDEVAVHRPTWAVRRRRTSCDNDLGQ